MPADMFCTQLTFLSLYAETLYVGRLFVRIRRLTQVSIAIHHERQDAEDQN